MKLSDWREYTDIVRSARRTTMLEAVQAVNREVAKRGKGAVDTAAEERIAHALVALRAMEQMAEQRNIAFGALNAMGWQEEAEAMNDIAGWLSSVLTDFEGEVNRRLGLEP